MCRDSCTCVRTLSRCAMCLGLAVVLDRVETPARSGMQFHSSTLVEAKSASLRWPILLFRLVRSAVCRRFATQRGHADTVGRVSWEQEAFVRSLSALSANTVAAYRRDVRDFVAWAERARPGRAGRRRPPRPAPVPGLPRHPAHGEAVDRPQGRRPAPLLRLADPHRRARRRPVQPAHRAHGARAACPTSCRPAELETLLADGRRAGDAGRASAERAVVELLYGSGLRVGELCGLRPPTSTSAGARYWCGARGPSSARCR